MKCEMHAVILIDTSALIEFMNRTGSPADKTVEQLINNADSRFVHCSNSS
jgi:hypothetical protein